MRIPRRNEPLRLYGRSVSPEAAGNILSGSGSFDQSNRFRQYIEIGQGKDDDFNYGEAVSRFMGKTQNLGVRRNRPIVIRAEGTVDLKKAQVSSSMGAGGRKTEISGK